MNKITIYLGSLKIDEIEFGPGTLTLGRAVGNDIRLEDSTVSGFHAVLVSHNNITYLEDRNSTNGSFINGRAIKKQTLCAGDTLSLGNFQIIFQADNQRDPTMAMTMAVTKITSAHMNKPISKSATFNSVNTPKVVRQEYPQRRHDDEGGQAFRAVGPNNTAQSERQKTTGYWANHVQKLAEQKQRDEDSRRQYHRDSSETSNEHYYGGADKIDLLNDTSGEYANGSRHTPLQQSRSRETGVGREIIDFDQEAGQPPYLSAGKASSSSSREDTDEIVVKPSKGTRSPAFESSLSYGVRTGNVNDSLRKRIHRDGINVTSAESSIVMAQLTRSDDRAYHPTEKESLDIDLEGFAVEVMALESREEVAKFNGQSVAAIDIDLAELTNFGTSLVVTQPEKSEGGTSNSSIPQSQLSDKEVDDLDLDNLPRISAEAANTGDKQSANNNTSTPYALELRDVCRQFGKDPVVNALSGISFSLEYGTWLSITGPSGAGKSTLLNILGCLDKPSSGSYSIDGIETTMLSDKQRTGIRSKRIGFVFQSFHLLPYRTVIENVMLAEVYRHGKQSGRRQRAMEQLERVGLSNRANYYPMNLSGGERQRVAIARALMGSPSILLCDEPTGNLDSNNAASILKLFEKFVGEGITLVVVTHDSQVAACATRQIHIIDGEMTEVSTSSKPGLNPRAIIPPRGSEKRSKLLRSGMSFRDMFSESLAGIFARPTRMLLTMLGVAIGLTALVATIGLTRTAGNRIISQFDEMAATELFIRARPGKVTGTIDPKAIPWDAAERLKRLNGVVACGTVSEVDVQGALVRSSSVRDPLNQSAFKLSVHAASPDLFRAVRAELKVGRFPDAGQILQTERVAVLGPDAAEQLGITQLQQLPAIQIGDQLYLVIGILRDVLRKPELMSSVIIPEGTARRYFGLSGPALVVIETKIGAAYLIAEQAPLALRPDNPRVLKVEVPQEPKRVKDEVKSDLDIMFYLLGGLSLIVGAIGIANITLVGIMERVGEIGLRRAIGASRSHIALQFLLESASMGFMGGLIGACIGILIVVSVSAYQLWTPVLDPIAPAMAPLVGGAIGLLSGLYPSMRAARLEPVEALRN